MKMGMFNRNPEDVVFDIPIFSRVDDYVRNYDLISADHLRSIKENAVNPFMQIAQIQDSEDATREFIRKYVTPRSSILDAGVGMGNLLANFSEYKCYGVDVSIAYLREAQSRGISVAMAKLEELPYVDQYFDAVVSCDVFEHVFRLDSVVDQILRVLKPGGVLVVRVPNKELLDSYLEDVQPYSHSHVRDFSLASLRLYLEKCFGLVYLEHKYSGYIFNSFHQIKYKHPGLHSGLRLSFSEVIKKNPDLLEVREFIAIEKLLSSSVEETVDLLIDMRKTYPEIFSFLAPELLDPVELIAVFQKAA